MAIQQRKLGSTRRHRLGREQDVLGLRSEQVAIGASNVTVAFSPIRNQEGWLLKYQKLGGTLEISGSTGFAGGLSYPVQAQGAGYLMDVGESISIDGPAAFYMTSSGATSIVHVIRTLTAGYWTQSS